MKYGLFVCSHNAGRSQMAQGFFEQLAPDDIRAESAGSEPAQHVWPQVIEVMCEVGVDLSGRRPRKLLREMQLHADWAVTMCCGDACPYVPTTVESWDMPDPAGLAIEEVRAIRDQIEGSPVVSGGWGDAGRPRWALRDAERPARPVPASMQAVSGLRAAPVVAPGLRRGFERRYRNRFRPTHTYAPAKRPRSQCSPQIPPLTNPRKQHKRQIEGRVRHLVEDRLDDVRWDRTAHQARLLRLLPALAQEFDGLRSDAEIRACTDAILDDYDDVPIRSHIMTLAHRRTRECLRAERCDVLAVR